MANSYVETVAESIIKQLEQGTAPWVKPWQPGERFMPYNPTSENEYRGMNAIWLLSVAERQGYTDSRWMTYKQANAADAQVNKREKGSIIQFWQWTEERAKLDEAGKPLLDEAGKAIKELIRLQFPKVRSAVVFNAEQISGLPEIKRTAPPEWKRHAEAESILKDSGAMLIFQRGDRAFYRPSTDSITLPERRQFESPEGFYATALHELGHWTGHESRLKRDLSHPFGSMGYAKEELRAEIASLMLGEQLGIGHDPGQHVAYIQSWIQALQEDPREIFRASADAEKMVKYLRGREMNQEQKQEQGQQIERSAAIQVPVVAYAEEVKALKSSSDRIYLVVPYAEKEQAKALGAKWDRIQKSWYAASDVELEPLKRWQPENARIETVQSPEREFSDALQAAGLRLDGWPIMDAKMHRVPVVGDKKGEKSGAYVGFMDGHPAGYINNYKTGYEAKWKSNAPQQKISAEELVKLEAETAEKLAARAQAQETLYQQTADLITAHWQSAKPAQGHPYLTAKGVKAHGLRVNIGGPLTLQGSEAAPQRWNQTGELLIPVQDIDGKLWAAQSIDVTGRKSFPRGSKIQGGHHVIGMPQTGEKLLIAEGYATAATLHEVTGLPVVVAFHSGNLPFVAEVYREKYPEKTILITGDNDHHKPIEKNVGRLKAEEAAQKVNGYTILPKFEKTDAGTDWNDLLKSKCRDEVLRQFHNGMKAAERKQLMAKIAVNREIEQKPTPKEIVHRKEPEKQLAQRWTQPLLVNH